MLVIPERSLGWASKRLSKSDALDMLVRVEAHIFRMVPHCNWIDEYPDLAAAQRAVFECERQLRREIRNGLIPLLPA